MKSTTIIFALMLSGCDTVTEYKCSDEQIVKARAQFEWCKAGNPDTPNTCWIRATKAHCEVHAQYKRTGVDLSEDGVEK